MAMAIIFSTALATPPGQARNPILLWPLYVRNAAGLSATFTVYRYDWPPATGKIPALELRHLPAGLGALPVKRKKTLFMRALLPMVLAVNNRIRRERAYILRALKHNHGGAWPQHLLALAAYYDIQGSLSRSTAQIDLLRRCNVVPPALVLAQAAKESGWGTSRFALQGNNLFGVYTWTQPGALRARDNHSIQLRVYPDLRASIRGYVHNLNVGHAYVAFRKLRARQFYRGHTDPIALARMLGSYSELGEVYIRRLRRIIKSNRLDSLPRLQFATTKLTSLEGI